MGMSGHMCAGPLRACVKVDNCFDQFSTGTLTCVKILEMGDECVATECVRSAIAGHFLLFGEDG
jgi:hypothetical protein